jgi:hypothetical protein
VPNLQLFWRSVRSEQGCATNDTREPKYVGIN